MKFTVAKEGIKYILSFFIFSILSAFFFKIPAVILLMLTLFSIYFFRKPIFKVEEQKNYIYSPAWGKVTSIENIEGKFIHISIFLSVFDVHLQCMPVSGVIESTEYKKGRFLNALNEQSGEFNEKNVLVIKSGNYLIEVAQIAGLIARRIVCFSKKNDFLNAGEYFGLIQFGSRVDIKLPIESSIKIKKGDRVEGGKTIIGEFHV